jgi:hypothetical protein
LPSCGEGTDGDEKCLTQDFRLDKILRTRGDVWSSYGGVGDLTVDEAVNLLAVASSAADFAKLASDATVIVTSTRDVGHTHTFFVVCA